MFKTQVASWASYAIAARRLVRRHVWKLIWRQSLIFFQSATSLRKVGETEVGVGLVGQVNSRVTCLQVGQVSVLVVEVVHVGCARYGRLRHSLNYLVQISAFIWQQFEWDWFVWQVSCFLICEFSWRPPNLNLFLWMFICELSWQQQDLS